MTPQELKNSILQLAIQGRLVEQRPEEGTAQELYKQIQAEKQRLIKAGKIKKEKPLPEIAEDEKPFEIPESWMWVRLGTCILLLSGSDLVPSKYNNHTKGIPYITGASNIEKGNIIINRWTEFPSNIATQGCLLLTCKGTVGKTAILTEPYVHIARQIMALMPIIVDVRYLQLFVECQVELLKKKAKSMIPGIERNVILNISFPLPPLAEQKRIVTKIEELLPLVDRYEAAWTRLEDFNRHFPEDMKKSILQQAIQGKLVEQRPEEGTAQELYEEICTEKQRLIKEGKIKKEKPLPEITEDEKPFEIPESWMWVRFSDLMIAMSTGPFGSMLHKSDYVAKGIPLVNPANIVHGKIIPSEKMMVSPSTAKRLESYTLYTGMIVIGRRGEMGRCAVVSENENGWICGTGSFFLTPSPSMFSDYIQTIFSTHYAKAYLSGESVGTTMSNLNHKILSKMPVPLPPLPEQKRIVARLEKLLPLCKRLK